jgi:hypothetical protein
MDSNYASDSFPLESEAPESNEQIKITPDEIQKFETAFKDPKFRNLFMDYVKELSDPNTKAVSTLFTFALYQEFFFGFDRTTANRRIRLYHQRHSEGSVLLFDTYTLHLKHSPSLYLFFFIENLNLISIQIQVIMTSSFNFDGLNVS